MIKELTPQQEQLMVEVRDEWIGKLTNCKLKLKKTKAKKLINWLYTFSGLEKPIIIFVDSPLGCQYAVNMLRNIKGSQVESQVESQVGSQVESQVESQVWSQVWSQVRSQVGSQVRSQVWSQVRSKVGSQVRSQVWSQVRSQVRSQVWSQVGSQVESQVWSQVRSQVGSQVRSQVGSQVRSQVGSQVRSKVGSQVGSQVESQVESQVWSQVWSQVRSQVRSQKLEYESFSTYGSVWDYSWCGFYDFFKRIGVVENDNFDTFLELLDSGVYDMIQMSGVCIVSAMPTKIQRDENYNLHSGDSPAIEFSDGYSQNYLSGVYFDDKTFKKVTNPKVTLKTIFSLENMEQRMSALKLVGMEKLLKHKNAKLLDKSKRGNSLYKISDVFSRDAYFLSYECPSTGRKYVSGIDPKVGKNGNADEAMAWKFSLSLDEYNGLEIES